MQDHRCFRAGAEVHAHLDDAADVGGGDDVGLGSLDGFGFALAEVEGDFGMLEIVGASGTAADLALWNFQEGQIGNGL